MASALEKFVERLVDYVPVNQQNMTFPDFLVLMSQRRNSVDHQIDSNLHPGIDLFIRHTTVVANFSASPNYTRLSKNTFIDEKYAICFPLMTYRKMELLMLMKWKVKTVSYRIDDFAKFSLYPQEPHLTTIRDFKTILEWMWAHGKFLTDSQAQAIINKIDQKQDGKVKHKVSVIVL